MELRWKSLSFHWINQRRSLGDQLRDTLTIIVTCGFVGDESPEV